MPELRGQDASSDGESASGTDDDLKLLEEMDIDRDFNVWGDFRKSVRSVSSEASKSLNATGVGNKFDGIAESDAEEGEEKDATDKVDSDATNGGCTDSEPEASLAVSFSALTPGERRDIRSWNIRLSRDVVFSRYYYPEQWELREMKTLVEFLELEIFRNMPRNIQAQQECDATKKAITSIFFPGDHDPKAVLLKRGPVLLDGAAESELLLFTHGFVLSRIAFDSLLDILFTINSENPHLLGPEQLKRRFDAIDSDRSGRLDRDELTEVFSGMGLPVSVGALDDIFERFDSDNDGTIDVDEFVTAMQSHLAPKKKTTWNSLSDWGQKLKRGLKRGSSAEQKVDCANLFSDIEKVEVVNICSSDATRGFANSVWADLAFAVFVRGGGDPLMMVCSKPEQRCAWVDAFRTCYVKSVQTKAHGGSEAAKNIAFRVGWQHRIIRASLFSLVVCEDLLGLREQVAKLPSPDIDIDDQDEYRGFTALHYAVVLDHVQSAGCLLRHGAKVNLCDNDQKTPLDHAMLLENEDMIRLLKGFGAKTSSAEVLFKSAIEEQKQRVEEQKEGTSGEPESQVKTVMAKAKEATGAMLDGMSALRERGEKIEELDDKTSQLRDKASNYADMARMMKEKNKKKSKLFGVL